jgi:hypothetical protein
MLYIRYADMVIIRAAAKTYKEAHTVSAVWARFWTAIDAV